MIFLSSITSRHPEDFAQPTKHLGLLSFEQSVRATGLTSFLNFMLSLSTCVVHFSIHSEVRNSAVDWDTAPQTERLQVWFHISTWGIFPRSGRTMVLVSTQTLTEISTRNRPWGVKAAGAQGWRCCHLNVSTVWKFWAYQSPGAVGDYLGLYRAIFTFIICHN
jgi:hypothetical protein